MRVAGSVSLLRQLMKDPPNAFDADTLSSTFLNVHLWRVQPGNPSGAAEPRRRGRGGEGENLAWRSLGLERSSAKQNLEWILGSEASMLGHLAPCPFPQTRRQAGAPRGPPFEHTTPRACQWWEPRRGGTCCSE